MSVVDVVRNAVELSLRETLRLICPAVEKPTLIIAVSGGLDSICLLDAVAALSASIPIVPVVCHVDHGLRESSARDARHVAAVTQGLGIRFELRQAPLWDERENLEAWARRIRYKLFEEVRSLVEGQGILTAHHQNDQAETVLLRLLSGRLATDSRSIASVSPARHLIRPLLGISREQLMEYARERDLSWHTDETNVDTTRTRNHIRSELLPWLARKYNPRVVADLSEVAHRLGQDEHQLWAEVESLLGTQETREVAFISKLPSAYQWRLLSLLAREDVGPRAGKLGYRKLNDVAGHLGSVSRESLGFGIDIDVRNRSVRFCSTYDGASEMSFVAQLLAVPGSVSYPCGDEGTIEVSAEVFSASDPQKLITLARSDSGDPERLARVFFDSDELGSSELLIRPRREGDSVRVFARGGRLLKKLYQERGVREALRLLLPIVERNGEVIWVPGVARSEHAPLTGDTKKVISLSYFKRPNP